MNHDIHHYMNHYMNHYIKYISHCMRHSANEQQRGMEFNFVRLRHMLLDLCTGNAAICALPQWPVLKFNGGRNLYSFKIPKKLCGRTGGFARNYTIICVSYRILLYD